MRDEREGVQKHFHLLKTEMNDTRARERGELANLTLRSNAAIKKLKK